MSEINTLPITPEDLSKYQEIDKTIKNICNIWAAQNGYGYTASNIKIHADSISFDTRHYDGIIYAFLPCDHMPIKYLFNTSNIEIDAKEYYDKQKEKRMLEWNERQELEKHPSVVKYKQLTGNPNEYIRL